MRIHQLVVRRSTNNLAVKIGDCCVIEHSTHRTRCQNVQLFVEKIAVVADRNATKFFNGALHCWHMHVGHHDRSASRTKQLCQLVTRRATSLNADGKIREINLATKMSQACLHRIEATKCSPRTRITAMRNSFAAHDVATFLRHPITELRTDSNIFCSDVRTAVTFNESTHRAPLSFRWLFALLVQEDDTLAAAESEIRSSCFVCHSFGESQHIENRIILISIMEASRSTKRVAKHCRVDRNDRP